MGVLGELNHTPNGTKMKNKTPLKSPHRAPVGMLSPNNDALEKRRGKLARQASETQKRSFADALDEVHGGASGASSDSTASRKPSGLSRSSSIASAGSSQPPKRGAVLSADAVLNLYSNCIKLASENKINAKNTWSLALIDHISEIVADSKDEDGQTNFQKSSCTLDAGVKIYASRVDSFHNETFKMLGGMNKVSGAGAEDEATDAEAGAKGDGEGLDGDDASGDKQSKRRANSRSVATLEAPDAHTVKAVEEAVAVDPLFQKTSALFDEGGASGLLLNNLSVHRGCGVCFDSEEVPEYDDYEELEQPLERGATVDLSSLEGAIRAAAGRVERTARITPSVAVIEGMLAELVGGEAPSVSAAERRAEDSSGAAAGVSLFDFSSGDGVQFAEYDDTPSDDEGDDGFGGGDFAAGAFDDDGAGFDLAEEAAAQGAGRDGPSAAVTATLDEEGGVAGLEWVVNAGLGGKMAWAGPSHWRFKAPARRTQGPHAGAADERDEDAQPKKRREKGELTFDFENPGEPDEARFTLAATTEELLLTAAPVAVDTLLPPDLGYEAADLARLSLRPRAGVSGLDGARGAAARDDAADATAFGGAGGFDDGFDDGFGGGFDGGDDEGTPGGFASDEDTPGADGLVEAPRRVEKIQVNYARSTKQVDVKELKSTLWENINDPSVSAPSKSGAHSFHALLDRFPEDNLAGATEDISVHMAFICMLHLANEHGLKITDRPEMNDLDISNLPAREAAAA